MEREFETAISSEHHWLTLISCLIWRSWSRRIIICFGEVDPGEESIRNKDLLWWFRIAAEGGSEKNTNYTVIHVWKHDKITLNTSFLIPDCLLGFPDLTSLIPEESPVFFLIPLQTGNFFLFHFIFRTPPHPPPHLRTEQPRSKESSGIVSYGFNYPIGNDFYPFGFVLRSK